LFTHKRNLTLLDNILVTDPSSPVAETLATRLVFASSPGTDVVAGINDAHDFSDHNSVWAIFAPKTGS
jgi:hypothetical protein